MIDANIFIGESLYENSVSPEEVCEKIKSLGIVKAIVRPLKPVDMDFDRVNRWIGTVQNHHPELIGFGRVNPLLPDASEQAVRAIHEYGLKGLHLHPWEENVQIHSPKVDTVIEAIEERFGKTVPFYISAGFPVVSHPLQIKALVSRHPLTKFLVTHGGQQDISGMSFEDSLILAKEHEHVYFDVAGVYRRDFIELLYKQVGEGRLVFGSCSPYMDMHLEICRISATHLPEKVKENIFSENIKNVLAR